MPINDENTVSRYEDMSPDGHLTLHQQPDGDFILQVWPSLEDQFASPVSVEFCTCGSGGGRSPHTRKALKQLFEAMQKDNEENPISRG